MRIERRDWFSHDIRKMCIKNDYYTGGTIKDYEALLRFVDEHEPTVDNIESVAYDIVRHSDLSRYNQTEEENVDSVMFEIAEHAVCLTYEAVKE